MALAIEGSTVPSQRAREGGSGGEGEGTATAPTLPVGRDGIVN